MKCPVHHETLRRSATRYGDRFDCPRDDCDVMCWDGPTSTPANAETRRDRKRTHQIFDLFWQKLGFHRGSLYRHLAMHLGLPQDETHIGMFNSVQCQQTREFCRAVARGEIEVRKKKERSSHERNGRV